MRLSRSALTLSFAAALAAEPLLAQESKPPGPAAGQAKPAAEEAAAPVFYETTTVTARPVSSATGAVTVIDGGEIETSSAGTASEALAEVPGLTLLSSGGRSGVTNAFLRGSDPNYTLVLLDGIPLNDSTELQGGAVNLEELSLAGVERVEVVRGPLASFYGTSALAGVVQLFSPRGGPGPLRGRAGVEGGDASLRHAFASLRGPLAAGGFATGASWNEESRRVASDRFRQLDAWFTADLVLGSRASLALSGRFADGETDDYPDASGGPVYGDGRLRHSGHRDLAIGARLDLGSSPGRRQRVSLALARRTLDRLSPAIAPVVPESDERTAYSRARVGWLVPLVRSNQTSIDLGLSGEGEWGDNTSVLRLPPEAGGDVPGDYSRDRLSAGAFAGARHERGALLYEAALRLDRPRGASLQANPHLGVVWRPGPGTTRVRASLGRASKLPSFFALASPPALGGNPALEPERVWGGEAGVEHAFRESRIELGATYFRQEYDNLVDFDFERFLHVNRARVRTEGAELSGRWQLHATLSLAVEATYLEVRDLAGGRLLHTPRWTGGGRLAWQPSPRLGLRIHWRARSAYLDQQYPEPGRDTVEGHGLVGAAGSWRFSRDLSLRARADNLTDRSYETLIGFPGPGRSYRAGIVWDRR